MEEFAGNADVTLRLSDGHYDRIPEAAILALASQDALLMTFTYVTETDIDEDESDYVARVSIRIAERLAGEIMRFAHSDPPTAAQCVKCKCWFLDLALGTLSVVQGQISFTYDGICKPCADTVGADADEKYDPCDREDTGIPKS